MRHVDEPVLVAVIGVGGVLVGAVGSGGVQAYLSRSDRRRDGRHAARVLYMEMHEGELTLLELRPRRDWNNMITDWDAFGVAWAQYRDQLTHVLSTERFAYVDSAFASIATLSRARTRDLAKAPPPPGSPPNFDPPDAIVLLYLQVVQRAKRIVLKASFRWWEIWARRRALAE
jgi:hypothetical protein